MFHVINELTIYTCDIHQIKENAQVKPDRWLSFQRHAAAHWSIISTPAIPLLQSLATSGQGTKDLIFEPFSLLWADNMFFILSRTALTNYPSVCKPLYYLKKKLTISPFHLLIAHHFWHLLPKMLSK